MWIIFLLQRITVVTVALVFVSQMFYPKLVAPRYWLHQSSPHPPKTKHQKKTKKNTEKKIKTFPCDRWTDGARRERAELYVLVNALSRPPVVCETTVGCCSFFYLYSHETSCFQRKLKESERPLPCTYITVLHTWTKGTSKERNAATSAVWYICSIWISSCSNSRTVSFFFFYIIYLFIYLFR